MNQDSYKAWIDAMPIDDVRRRTERLERKLSDLRVLERVYADRHGGGLGEPDSDPGPADDRGAEPAEGEGSPGGDPGYQQG
jgi:hypothetical protein